MKWYFACNEHSKSYEYMIKAAVESAIQNTRLNPNFIYDGSENDLTKWLESKGVNVIYHSSSFYEELVGFYKDGHLRTASGAYLRCDIPLLESEDDYVLYTDCDVIFLKDPSFENIDMPEYFACSSEIHKDDWTFFNTGVMLMNIPKLKEDIEDFKKFTTSNFPLMDAYDQTAYNLFYKNRISKLPIELNWKPYWGIDELAQIIHFHGSKPHHYTANHINNWPPIYKMLFSENPESCYYYLKSFKNYYLDITYDIQGLIKLTTAVIKEKTTEDAKPKIIKVIEKYKRSVSKRVNKFKNSIS